MEGSHQSGSPSVDGRSTFCTVHTQPQTHQLERMRFYCWSLLFSVMKTLTHSTMNRKEEKSKSVDLIEKQPQMLPSETQWENMRYLQKNGVKWDYCVWCQIAEKGRKQGVQWRRQLKSERRCVRYCIGRSFFPLFSGWQIELSEIRWPIAIDIWHLSVLRRLMMMIIGCGFLAFLLLVRG